MKRIVILYHSGVGSTKKVAEKLYKQFSKAFETSLYSVEKIPTSFDLEVFDGIVIGFPVIHTHPSKRILAFIDAIEKLSRPTPAYIYSTCGLYSANTLRIFAKRGMLKNVIPAAHRVFRGCPASDGSLLAPCIKSFFAFPRTLDKSIRADVHTFSHMIQHGEWKLNMPRFKLYSILNYPNKLAGQRITFPIYIHKDSCKRCGKCSVNCPALALDKNDSGYPVFLAHKCERCYRCIHGCPQRALSLHKKKTPQKILNEAFFQEKGSE